MQMDKGYPWHIEALSPGYPHFMSIVDPMYISRDRYGSQGAHYAQGDGSSRIWPKNEITYGENWAK